MRELLQQLLEALQIGRDQSNVGLAEFISGVRFAEIRHGIWNKE
jgi:hypothetical protein